MAGELNHEAIFKILYEGKNEMTDKQRSIECGKDNRCETVKEMKERVDWVGRDMYSPAGKMDRLQRALIYMSILFLGFIGGAYLFVFNVSEKSAEERVKIRKETAEIQLKITDRQAEIIRAIEKIKR